jgi:hypothetical protein
LRSWVKENVKRLPQWFNQKHTAWIATKRRARSAKSRKAAAIAELSGIAAGGIRPGAVYQPLTILQKDWGQRR